MLSFARRVYFVQYVLYKDNGTVLVLRTEVLS